MGVARSWRNSFCCSTTIAITQIQVQNVNNILKQTKKKINRKEWEGQTKRKKQINFSLTTRTCSCCCTLSFFHNFFLLKREIYETGNLKSQKCGKACQGDSTLPRVLKDKLWYVNELPAPSVDISWKYGADNSIESNCTRGDFLVQSRIQIDRSVENAGQGNEACTNRPRETKTKRLDGFVAPQTPRRV